MLISLIVAHSANRAIGINGQLPWHIPDDLKYFKAITTGKPIIMGRKTFESIGKPLPERLNIVITTNVDLTIENCLVVNNLETAILEAQNFYKTKGTEQKEIFIIGGAQIFKQSMEFVNRIYITEIHAEYAGDVFFEELRSDDWVEVSRDIHNSENDIIPFSFVLYEKK
ncbi:MAG: dihydrofolate reductase [Rhodobiaceae bacterium]|nr:dihydrofolate reductase [Rhodobiaceae bacterium]RPF96553.1 MAG: dihydrofolate reductase [Rhizobiales bacterium TMED227]|tara:strand:- start:20 stop:526 length:507 start_codon:yes stop_codon:yes gene_type:complete